jgi:hypothetical protein
MLGEREIVTKLDAVRSAARDSGAAYLIRSRLRRTLLACAREVAEAQGLEKPVYPGQWVLSGTPDPQLVEVVEVCRRIHQRSKDLCAPSESFDVRWEEGWRRLSADLDVLQEQLEALASEAAVSA